MTSQDEKLNALTKLIALIDSGMEYPDAHTEVCLQFRLTDVEATKLTKVYDNFSAIGVIVHSKAKG